MAPELALVVSTDADLRTALAADPRLLTVVDSAADAVTVARREPIEGIAVHVRRGAALDELSILRTALPGTPIILVSEDPSYDLLPRALGFGVDGYLTGHLSGPRLRKAIAEARAHHDEQHRLASASPVASDATRLEHYRRVFDELPLLILVTRARHGRAVVVDCNPHACSALGYRRDQLVGRPLGEFYTPESRRVLESGGYNRALTGEFFAEERQLVTADGRTIETLLRAIPDEGPDGERGTIAFFADISDSKRNARQLQESQAHQSALLAAIPDIVLRINAAAEVVDHHVPGGASSIACGLPLASCLATLGLPGGLAATIAPGLDRALAAHQAEVVEFAAGDEAAFVVRIVPCAADEAVVILQDVTEQRRTERTLRERDEALRQSQKMESIGLLAGGIAHDFNNLLTAIIGLTQLVMESLDDDDPRKADLAQVDATAQRAAAMTGQLLAFSRRQVLQPQRLDVHAVLEALAVLIRRMLSEDIDLRIETRARHAVIEADRSQLEQSILNLVVNARAAMPQGGCLTIATAQDAAEPGHDGEGQLVLTVTDTGVGMADEVRARIFEPFFTTKPLGEGTGLGLSMVYGFTQQSGGRITVDSSPGAGTTFRLYFPVAAGDAGVADDGRAPASRVPVVQAGTVLLVEDESEVRRVAGLILRRAGFAVLEAASAAEALSLWQEHGSTIDLLLSDVVMPGMNGFALAHSLRQASPAPHRFRVLLMSGYTDHPLVRQDHASNEPLLRKPFTAEELRRRVAEVLSNPPS